MGTTEGHHRIDWCEYAATYWVPWSGAVRVLTHPQSAVTSGTLRAASWVRSSTSLARDVAPSEPSVLHWPVPLLTKRFAVAAWTSSARRGAINRDALAVVEYDKGLTLGITDGCTPTSRTPAVDEEDGARHAAHCVLKDVAEAPMQQPLLEVLESANTRLLNKHGPMAKPHLKPRDRPQTAAAVVRIVWGHSDDDVRQVEIARAADCEVWYRKNDGWFCLTPEDMLTERARQEITRWVGGNPHASLADRFVMEEQELGDRRCWRWTALGRFTRPKVESVNWVIGRPPLVAGRPKVDALPTDFDELVLMTDGTPAGTLIRDGHVDAARWASVTRAEGYRRDDLTLLRVVRSPQASTR